MDHEIRVQELREKVRAFVDEREWDQFHHPKDLAISLTLEAAELLEVFQWMVKPTEEVLKDPKIMAKIKEELADILIYAISIANKTNIDISEIIQEKLLVNAKKYPVSTSKGSNKKYREI